MSTDDPNQFDPEALRPVAIGGARGGWDEDAAEAMPEGGDALAPMDGDEAPPQQSRYEPPPVERPLDELLVGLSALVLAVTTFLPWYFQAGFAPLKISGWASGNWGVVGFFIAAASLAIVGLRLARVPVTLPYPHGLTLEGLGWAAVVLLIAKRFMVPDDFFVSPPWAFESWFWLSLLGALGIAMFASRLSKDAPIMVIPGWFKGRAGAIGVAILAIAVAGSAAFGLTNSVQKARDAALKRNTPASVTNNSDATTTKGYPQCAKDAGLPVPEGLRPVSGTTITTPIDYCSVSLSSKLRVAEVLARYQKALREAGWKFQVLPATGAQGRVVSLSEPQCGTLVVTTPDATKVTTVTITVSGSDQFCQATRFPPAPTPTRSN